MECRTFAETVRDVEALIWLFSSEIPADELTRPFVALKV